VETFVKKLLEKQKKGKKESQRNGPGSLYPIFSLLAVLKKLAFSSWLILCFSGCF
jgi:hypothetical protein